LLAKRDQPTAIFGIYGQPDDDTQYGYRMNESTPSTLAGMQTFSRETETVSHQLSTGEFHHYERYKK